MEPKKKSKSWPFATRKEAVEKLTTLKNPGYIRNCAEQREWQNGHGLGAAQTQLKQAL